MEESRPPRGRARGRSRGILPGQDVEPMEIGAEEAQIAQPMQVEQQQLHRAMYGSSDEERSVSGSGNGSVEGNGDRSPNGNGNGNGGNGHGQAVAGAVLGRVAGTRGFRQDNPEFMTTLPPGFIKKGTSGTRKFFYANFFELQSRKNVSMRLHSVTFHPEVDEYKIRRALLKRNEQQIGPYVFDGGQLFTAKELPPEALEFNVKFPDKLEVFTVKLVFLRTIASLEPLAFQLYNLIVKKTQQLLELELMGRYYFDPEGRIDISQHRLELWPGFITSMRQQESEVLLNVDLTYKVVRSDDVFKLMREIRQYSPDQYQLECEKAIIGTVVMTAYNNKTYRIDAIAWTTRVTDTFEVTRMGSVTTTTFIDYYKKKYDIAIRVVGQPLLVSRPRAQDIRRGDTADKALVPELCYQTGLNEEMRANFRLMKDMAQHLHQPPEGRLGAIKAFLNRIKGSKAVEAEIRNRWGMQFRPEPVEVQGRQMPPEQIVFRSGETQPNEQADWSIAFRNQKMLSCETLRNWAIVVTNRDAQNLENLIGTMKRVAGPLGYNIDKPEIIQIRGGTGREFQAGIQQLMDKHKSNIDMVMIILPTNKLETYAAVKKMCSLDYGVPSQCFLSKNVTSKGLMSICTKLVIQMNAKQGGEPWSVKNPLQGIMIVGFDVYHGGGQSYGAMTASVTPTIAKYFSTITSQDPGMEMSTKMGNSFLLCLKAYYRINGKLPSRVMFYRDGVGEGQLQYVHSSEVPVIKKVLERAYTAKGQPEGPKFTYIVVTKRINVRLFEKRGNQGQVVNPGPGCVVDDRITCPEKYDFYLIPQSVRQGTVSPVSFNVLTDNSGLDADKVQRFTFKLCHMYFNWSGTVPVPAPCQYSHKLALLTGTALQREANERLSDLLHFL